MVKQLIFHLGDTKTGSTSIQSVLRAKGYELAGKTIFYPTTGKNLNHNTASQTLYKEAVFDQRANRFGALEQKLSQSDADYGIVSAEFFQYADPADLKKTIEQFMPNHAGNVRLIAYVRPHAEKFLSSFSTQMRVGARQTTPLALFEKYTELDTLDYAPRFKKWRDVFGDAFTLRLFSREHLHRQDVLQDFFQFVTGADKTKITWTPYNNPSLKVGQIALLRYLIEPLAGTEKQGNKRHLRGELSRILARNIEESKVGTDTPRVTMSRKLMARFVKRYETDAIAMDEAFFTGNPMTKALQNAKTKLAAPPQSLRVEDYFSEAELRSFALMSNVLCTMADADPAKMTSLARALRLELNRQK
ncbi:hypothetical protein [Donghicola mangrovi]|uniref:Uncharacterized protein n=1 Tax=Donghicola mangrovi TaxID=2729614 RepID=A0A850Q5G9_9RHOB|nr:hypothetical protein [Donghicola mangrovi]NVO24957.1 hypothetical protein [Donghicola mangrovi]